MIVVFRELSGATAFQVVRIVTPLIIFPALVHTYGIIEFGVFTFLIGWIGLHVVFVEFGSNLHGMRNFTSAENQHKKVLIVTCTTIVRSVLALITLLLSLLVAPDQFILILLSSVSVILQQNYIFQSSNKFGPLIIGFLTSRLIFFMLLISECFVTGRDLAIVFVACNVLGALTLHLADRIKILRFLKKVSINDVVLTAQELTRFFLSGLSTSLNTSGVLAICGLFLHPELIGKLALIDKARSSAIAASYPINQLFMRRWYKKSPDVSIRATSLIYLFVGIFQIILFMMMLSYFWWQDWEYLFDKNILIYFPFIFLIINVGYVYGTLGLLSKGHEKLYLRNTLIGSGFLLIFILTLFSGYFSGVDQLYFIVFAMFTTELLISCLMAYEYRKALNY